MRISLVRSLLTNPKWGITGRRLRRAAASAAVAIVAGGVSFCEPALANELVINGSFENNNGFNGDNSGFGWTTTQGADTSLGFDVYSHATQVYYAGPAPAGAGEWYFHTVGLGTLGSTPVVVEQEIDLSAVTDSVFVFSAQISGFVAGGDTATIDLVFDDTESTTFTLDGTTGGADGVTNTWDGFSVTGSFPAGATTATIAISQATAGSSNGNDNYVDLVSLVTAPSLSALFPTVYVNTGTGEATLLKAAGDDIDFNYYELSSATENLSFNAWESLADQGVDSLGPNPEDNWTEAGQSDDGLLAELFLTGTSAFSTDTLYSLGEVYNTQADTRDIVFQYAGEDGTLVPGLVQYLGELDGDYNGDGSVNAADYTRWRDNLGQSVTLPNDATPGSVTIDDYQVWRANFAASSGQGGHGAAAPEPGATAVALVGAFGLVGRLRSRG